jgi:hypothetical protein
MTTESAIPGRHKAETEPEQITQPAPERPLYRRPKVIIPVAAGFVALAAIIGATIGVEASQQAAAKASAQASADARAVFLEQWHGYFTNTKATDDQTVSLAQGVCRAYDSGTTFIGEVEYLRSLNPAFTAGDAGEIIGMSTAAFCPQYNNRH